MLTAGSSAAAFEAVEQAVVFDATAGGGGAARAGATDEKVASRIAFDDELMAVASFILRATLPLELSLSVEFLRPVSIGLREVLLLASIALLQSSEMRVFTRARMAAALRFSATNVYIKRSTSKV